MEQELQTALLEVREKLLTNPVSPRVDEPADINLHYCRYVAQTVAERVSDDVEIEILEDGGRGFVHTWLRHDGRHYDAECIDGVDDYRDLPFFQRHPEAAIQVEPGTKNPATIRSRGRTPLYPEVLTAEPFENEGRIISTDYWLYAVAGVSVGLLLLLVGLLGEWALHEHLLQQSAELHVLFYDLEVFGELIALVSPIIFFFLFPAYHGQSLW